MKAITALGFGSAIGAATAIMLAPKCGKATRVDFVKRVQESIVLAAAKGREIVRHTTEVVGHLKHEIHNVRVGIDAGVDAFREGRMLYRL